MDDNEGGVLDSKEDNNESSHDLLNRARKLIAVLTLLCVMMAFSAIVTIVSYRQTRIARQQLISISKDNASLLRGVESCTQPEGECYQAGIRTRMLLENEAQQVNEHRDRNEELHAAICAREDEIAKALDIELKTDCPEAIHPEPIN